MGKSEFNSATGILNIKYLEKKGKRPVPQSGYLYIRIMPLKKLAFCIKTTDHRNFIKVCNTAMCNF